MQTPTSHLSHRMKSRPPASLLWSGRDHAGRWKFAHRPGGGTTARNSGVGSRVTQPVNPHPGDQGPALPQGFPVHRLTPLKSAPPHLCPTGNHGVRRLPGLHTALLAGAHSQSRRRPCARPPGAELQQRTDPGVLEAHYLVIIYLSPKKNLWLERSDGERRGRELPL